MFQDAPADQVLTAEQFSGELEGALVLDGFEEGVLIGLERKVFVGQFLVLVGPHEDGAHIGFGTVEFPEFVGDLGGHQQDVSIAEISKFGSVIITRGRPVVRFLIPVEAELAVVPLCGATAVPVGLSVGIILMGDTEFATRIPFVKAEVESRKKADVSAGDPIVVLGIGNGTSDEVAATGVCEGESEDDLFAVFGIQAAVPPPEFFACAEKRQAGVVDDLVQGFQGLGIEHLLL